jgi:hypothetical protein
MEGDTSPLCHGILQRAQILHTLRGVQDFNPDDVAVIVDNDTGLILITFLNRSIAQLDSAHVDFLVVFHFHGFFQTNQWFLEPFWASEQTARGA